MNYEKLLLSMKMEVRDDVIVFVASDIAQLCSVKLGEEGYELKILLSIPHGEHYRSTFTYENQIYIFPNCRGDVIVYDMVSEKYIMKPMPKELHNENEDNWSGKNFRYENSLYFGFRNPVITRYLWREDKWIVYRDWKKLLPAEYDEQMWFWGETFAWQKQVFFHIGNSNMFLAINDDTSETKIYSVKFSENMRGKKIVHVMFDGEYIWIQTLDEKSVVGIYRSSIFDFKAEKIVDIPLKQRNYAMCPPPFTIMEIANDKLYLLPGQADKAYLIDIKNRVANKLLGISAVNREEMNIERNLSLVNYMCGKRKDNYLYSFNIVTGELAVINLLSSECKMIALKTDKNKIVGQMLKISLREGDMLELCEFIECVKGKEKENKDDKQD